MKKKNFVSLLLGAVGGLLFGVGMCMCLLPAWGAFRPGIVVACIGLAVLLALLLVRRKMEHKPLLRFSSRAAGAAALGAGGALTLGVGMCMAMVWQGLLLPGILVGSLGILLLLCLVPMYKGLR